MEGREGTGGKGTGGSVVESQQILKIDPGYIDSESNTIQNKFVRPRWPYDMRPSARAEKYMCVIFNSLGGAT